MTNEDIIKELTRMRKNFDSNSVYGSYCIDCLDAAIEALRNSPTYLPSAQQWIPCSERLPDNDESVLISHSHGVTKAWWNGRFWTSIAVKKYKTVNAWMPLPKPYKGET